jgi:hypothetical protein
MTTGADWLDTARRVVDTFLAPPAAVATSPSAGPEPTAGEGTGHADTCRWCPVCQAVAVARGERPEVTAALADLLTTTAEALRTFAETVPAPEHGAGAGDGAHVAEEPTPEADAAEPPRPAQRIDIA